MLNRTHLEKILKINPSVSDEDLPKVALEEIAAMKEHLPISHFNHQMAEVATGSNMDVIEFVQQLEDMAEKYPPPSDPRCALQIDGRPNLAY